MEIESTTIFFLRKTANQRNTKKSNAKNEGRRGRGRRVSDVDESLSFMRVRYSGESDGIITQNSEREIGKGVSLLSFFFAQEREREGSRRQ